MNLLERNEFIKASPAIQIQGNHNAFTTAGMERTTRQRL